MLSGVRPIHPEIVGWSTAPRGQVINESLGQVPKKLVSRPARAGKDQIITDPIGYETGWTIARSLGEVCVRERAHEHPLPDIGAGPSHRKAKTLQFERHNDRSAWCP